MTTPVNRSLIPVYNSRGEADAFLAYPYLFNRNGEWVGWVTEKRQVYSVLGYYVGYMTNDPRILRKRATSTLKPRVQAPATPGRISLPATVPLAPMMSELTHSLVDVLLDEPDRLHPVDQGELREDVD
jgi:hypothetical protein